MARAVEGRGGGMEKAIRLSLTKTSQSAWGYKPHPWQSDAIVAVAARWPQPRFLIDHPRGAGKTKEMALLVHVLTRYLEQRLVFLVSDRTDLDDNLFKEVQQLVQHVHRRGHKALTVHQCKGHKDVERLVQELAEEPDAKMALCVTLQTFLHVRGSELPAPLRESTAVLADEAQRSHADKALSEELSRYLGASVPLVMYTGTATDRCLRLYGECSGGTFRPFHAASEEDVARRGAIFELRHFRRKSLTAEHDLSAVSELAKKHGNPELVQLLSAAALKGSSQIPAKAAVLLKEFKAQQAEAPGKRLQLMVITDSRERVRDFSEAFRTLVERDGSGWAVYGAFSGTLPCQEGEGHVDERSYNRVLFEDASLSEEPHRLAHVLVVCDRFDVGYDNSAVKVMGIDRCLCPEKLVQVYSRANRRAPGLPVPLILDFQNHPKQVEEAIFQFSIPRMCLASGDATEVAAHSARIRELAQPVLGKPKEEIAAFLRQRDAADRRSLATALAPYLRCRKAGTRVGAEAGEGGLVPYSSALEVQKALQESFPSDVAAVRRLCSAIAATHLPLQRFVSQSSATLDSAPFACETPRRGGGPPSREPPETEEKTAPPQAVADPQEAGQQEEDPRIAALKRLQGELPGPGHAPAGAPQLVDAGLAEDAGEDVRALGRVKGALRQKGYALLARIVARARGADAAQLRGLVEAGAVDALVARLCAEACEDFEKNIVLDGLRLLAQSSPHAAGINDAQQQTQDIHSMQDSRRLKRALEKLRPAVLEAARKAEQEAGRQQEEEQLKKELGQLRSQAKAISSAAAAQSDDSSDGPRGSAPRGETAAAKKRRLAARRREQRLQRARRRSEAAEAKEAKEEELRKKQAERRADASMPSLLACGLLGALRHGASLCRQGRSGPCRALLVDMVEAVAPRAAAAAPGLAEAAAAVRAVKRSRLPTNRPLSFGATRLKDLSEGDMRLACDLGLVDDLVAQLGPKANEACVALLRRCAPLDPRAASQVQLFDGLDDEDEGLQIEEEEEDTVVEDRRAAEQADKTERLLARFRAAQQSRPPAKRRRTAPPEQAEAAAEVEP